MQLARTRTLFFLASFACALILGAAFYLDHTVPVFPCPLCTLQRVLYLFYGAICLLAAFHTPARSGWRLYSAFLLVIALLGAVTAGRQVWLQASPPEDMEACLINLHYLLDTQPYLKVLSLVFTGGAGCSEINWSLFGISIPEWSLLAFAGMSGFALYYLFLEFRCSASADTAGQD